MDYLLAMRANLVNYVNLIDIYAPCIVSTTAWNDETNMRRYCGSSNDLFHHHVLSKSDEAFLLLVLINYTGYWLSEMEITKSKVRLCVCVDNAVLVYKLIYFTYSMLLLHTVI